MVAILLSLGNRRNIMPKLTILTVNYNSSDFVTLSLYTLKKLTRNNYLVKIADTGSTRKDYEKLNNLSKIYGDTTVKKTNLGLTGSLAHGTALNYLTKDVTTPYFVILDADAVFLKQGWDEILINQIDNKTKIIGTQAPPQKPQDFPLMFAALFETETFLKLNISFTPKKIAAGQDTGFELREKYLSAGFTGKTINFYNTRNYKNGPFSSLTGVAEFYLEGYQGIFASHFGRGSDKNFNKFLKNSPISYKLPILGRLLRKSRFSREKNKWIEICNSVIESQK